MSILSWFRRKQPTPRRPFRHRPSDWAKTLDDLMSEKRTISSEEIEWARSYERDQLRGWARFPKNGEEFEASNDVAVNYLVHWQAPYTGGGKATIFKGTRVRVSLSAQDREPIGVYAYPLDDGQLERQLVSEAERSSKKYGGFSLAISVEQLNKEFRLIKAR